MPTVPGGFPAAFIEFSATPAIWHRHRAPKCDVDYNFVFGPCSGASVAPLTSWLAASSTIEQFGPGRERCDFLHRSQLRRRRILRCVSPRRRRRGHAQHDVGQRRVRVSRRRPGGDAGDRPAGPRRRRGRRRPSRLPRSRRVRPTGISRPRRARSRTSCSTRSVRSPRSPASEGVALAHVKPHGALYNMAARDRKLADAIARAIRSFDAALVLFALPGRNSSRQGSPPSLRVAAEGFADRAYAPDGSLTSRSLPGAVIHDPDEVVRRSLRMVREGEVVATDGSVLAFRVDTLCVHGDTAGAASLTDSSAKASNGAASPSAGSPRRAIQHEWRIHDRGGRR